MSRQSKDQRKSVRFPWGGVLGIFVVAALTPIFVVTGYAYFKTNLEFFPPTALFQHVPGAVSAISSPLAVRLYDSDSGLQALRVEIVQGSASSELMTKVFDPGVHEFDLEIPLKFDGSRVREGPIRVMVTAWDNSRWSNYAQIQSDLFVDVTSPEIQLLTGDAKLEQGGAGLVFFQANDFGGIETGMNIGSVTYEGFRASDLDASFKGAGENTYFVYFPVPLDFSNTKDKIKLYAKDLGGNLAELDLRFSLGGLTTESAKIQLSADNVKSKAMVLGIDTGIDLKGATLGPDMPLTFASQVLRQSLWLLSRDHEQKFQKIGIKSTRRRLWDGPFLFPYLKKAYIAHYGDEIEWSSSVGSLGRTRSTGLLLNMEKGSPVKAGNAGVVAFVGELGQFGRMVVVDHGFGLTTSYCFLSQSNVFVGNKIKGGDILGNVGSTGLGPEESTLIEVRLHGHPVDPLYWADDIWVRSHFDRVAYSAKSKLGM